MPGEYLWTHHENQPVRFLTLLDNKEADEGEITALHLEGSHQRRPDPSKAVILFLMAGTHSKETDVGPYDHQNADVCECVAMTFMLHDYRLSMR